MRSCGDACTLEPLDSIRFPWLFWGDRKVARNEQLLRSRNIAYIINCTPPCGEGGVPNFHERLSRGSRAAFRYLRIPVFDTQAETLQPHFEEVWGLMETCRTREDGNLLVHCNHGASRSVAFVCSYLIRFEGMSADEALAFVRRRNPLANPNEAFREQLKQLHERVLKESLSSGVGFRRVPEGGWVPPSSTIRKRVAARSLPDPRPQLRAVRQMGPVRPPELVSPPSNTSSSEEPSFQVDTTTPRPFRFSEGAKSPSDVVGAEGRHTLFAYKDNERVDPAVVSEVKSASSIVKAPDVLEISESQGSTSPHGCGTPSCNGKELDWVGSSDKSDETMGCKGAPPRAEVVELSRDGSERSCLCRRADGKVLDNATDVKDASVASGDPSAPLEPAVAQGLQGLVAATVGGVSADSPRRGGFGKEDSLANDTERNSGLRRSRDAPIWNARRLVDPADGHKAMQAAVLRVP